MVSSYYPPPHLKIKFVPLILEFFNNFQKLHNPDIIFTTADANYQMDNLKLGTSKATNAFLFENNLCDTFRLLHPDVTQNPGITFPPQKTFNSGTTID